MSIRLIPQLNAVDNNWIRQVFCASDGNQIVLHDRTYGIHLPAAGIRSIQVAAVRFETAVGDMRTDNLVSPVRIVAHIGGTREDVTNNLWDAAQHNPGRQAIILEVSSQEATSSLSAGIGNIVWLSMKSRQAYKKVSDWLPQFLDLTFEDAEKIANEPDRAALDPEIQRKYAQLLDITHPGDPAAPLAFRLLCEAWYQVNVAGNTLLSDFPITAPTNLDDWLKPFSPEGDSDPATIESVVAKMGDADTKEKAKKVLETANGEPRANVVAFLGMKGESSEKSEGGAQ
jgi:hypothetical protein